MEWKMEGIIVQFWLNASRLATNTRQIEMYSNLIGMYFICTRFVFVLFAPDLYSPISQSTHLYNIFKIYFECHSGARYLLTVDKHDKKKCVYIIYIFCMAG